MHVTYNLLSSIESIDISMVNPIEEVLLLLQRQLGNNVSSTLLVHYTMFRVAVRSGLSASKSAMALSVRNSTRALSTTRYTSSHEYVKLEGDIATVGITDFAAAALGDVVFVDLPSIGAKYAAGESFGSVESVKAASDVYSPVAGEVVEVNGVSFVFTCLDQIKTYSFNYRLRILST